MKTIHHLSHIDLDGYSCQLVMQSTPYTIYSYNANYGAEVIERLNQIIEAITKSSDDALILITDLNLYPDEAKSLDQRVKKLNDSGRNITIQLLDHHGSGAKTAAQYEWYFLDTDRSATKITYDYAKEHFEFLEPSWMNAYVDVVNAVDLWIQSEHDNFEYGKVCMRLVNETRELNRTIFSGEDRHYKLSLLAQAAEMLSLEDANIKLDEKIHLMKKAYFKEDQNDTLDNLSTKRIVALLGEKRSEMTIYYKGYRGFLSYAIGNTSIIGNGFLTTFPEYDFILDIGPRGTMSFRANNRVDVAMISKEWANGGGHPNAAGGRIQGFKEQFRYDKVKEQIQNLIDKKEAIAGDLEPKSS
ncbi:MAG: phosphoesterase [Campylobacterota bacterium]|nr:phosphoesterase [Campylobacterota bacterium]